MRFFAAKLRPAPRRAKKFLNNSPGSVSTERVTPGHFCVSMIPSESDRRYRVGLTLPARTFVAHFGFFVGFLRQEAGSITDASSRRTLV